MTANQTTASLTPTEVAILDIVSSSNIIHPYSEFECVCTKSALHTHIQSLRRKKFPIRSAKKIGLFYGSHPDSNISRMEMNVLNAIKAGHHTRINIARTVFLEEYGHFCAEDDLNTVTAYLGKLKKKSRIVSPKRGRYELKQEKESAA